MVTCLLYLSDAEEGGGTSFPNLDMEIRDKKGRLALFHNCHRAARPSPRQSSWWYARFEAREMGL